jgi:hypothetical protein
MFSSIKELEDRNRERQILKEEMTKAIHANSKIESNNSLQSDNHKQQEQISNLMMSKQLVQNTMQSQIMNIQYSSFYSFFDSGLH